MKKLIHEAHRRSLWQVLGIYLAAGWVVLQVVHQLVESAGLPDWVSPFAIVLLLIGLPIVLATAFVQEREGAERDAGVRAAATTSRAPAPVFSTRHRLFTWRNALLGGVLAFLCLTAVTTAFMFMRTRGIGPVGSLIASGVLDARSPLILATFESGDSDLARAATEAFRVDLSQSPVVRLVEPSFLASALDRMERPRDTPIDLTIGLEIAVREGVPAVFTGGINSAGGAYVVRGELVRAADGASLASHRETAADSTSVIDAINRVSRVLRERIGESYTSLRGSPPLETVTTRSLEALRKYTEAVAEDERNMDSPRAIALVEEAVAIDPEFAMAWRKLGVFLSNLEEQPGRALEAFREAYEHRDRLTDRERYLAVAAYNDWVLDRPDLAIQAYENMLALDPDDTWALNNLSVKYWQLGEFEKSAEFAYRQVAADSSSRAYAVGAVAAYDVGEPDLAVEWMAVASEDFEPNPSTRTWAAYLALDRTGDYEAFDRTMAEVASDAASNLHAFASAHQDLSRADAVRGRLQEAQAHLDRAEAAERDRGRLPEALANVIISAWFDLDVGQDAGKAVERVEVGLDRYPLTEMDPLERPYQELAMLYAATGRLDDAHRLMRELEAEAPAEFLNGAPGNGAATRAAMARAEGRYDDALEYARSERARGRRGNGVQQCARLCRLMSLALTFDAAGRTDSAIAYYDAYVNTPSFERPAADGNYLGRGLERLAALYDEKGDLENAAVYYARFVDLWADADPELQPRVEAARARLAEIVRERG